MCSAQYYLPISTFTNYTNTAISPVSGVASNVTLLGITTATNIVSVNIYGTNSITSYGTLNASSTLNASTDINVAGNINMNGGSGTLLLGNTGAIKIYNNSTYSVASWGSSNLLFNPPSSFGGIFFNFSNGTNGVRFGNGASGIVGLIDSSGNFTNKGYILTGSAISCNVVTNNGLIWYAYATNATPTFLTGPNGSICTTTNGQLFVRSNATWVLK